MTILIFDQARCRPATAPPPGPEFLSGPAEVLMFTGVRREPLISAPAPLPPCHPEPIFNDPAPGKPGNKKRRR